MQAVSIQRGFLSILSLSARPAHSSSSKHFTSCKRGITTLTLHGFSTQAKAHSWRKPAHPTALARLLVQLVLLHPLCWNTHYKHSKWKEDEGKKGNAETRPTAWRDLGPGIISVIIFCLCKKAVACSGFLKALHHNNLVLRITRLMSHDLLLKIIVKVGFN